MKIEYPFQVVEHTIGSVGHIRSVTSVLLAASQWFAVTPLPNDQWKVTIKVDAEHIMLNWMKSLHKRNAMMPYSFTAEDVWKVLCDAGHQFVTSKVKTVQVAYEHLMKTPALRDRITHAPLANDEPPTVEQMHSMMQAEIKKILVEENLFPDIESELIDDYNDKYPGNSSSFHE